MPEQRASLRGKTSIEGASEVLAILVAMTDDHELAALEATLYDEGRDAALEALDSARAKVASQIASYQGGAHGE